MYFNLWQYISLVDYVCIGDGNKMVSGQFEHYHSHCSKIGCWVHWEAEQLQAVEYAILLHVLYNYTHVYLATHGCRCSPVGLHWATDPLAKERERLQEMCICRAKASLCGHLDQLSCPQTVPAVWE